jgi:hypothetical protein
MVQLLVFPESLFRRATEFSELLSQAVPAAKCRLQTTLTVTSNKLPSFLTKLCHQLKAAFLLIH